MSNRRVAMKMVFLGAILALVSSCTGTNEIRLKMDAQGAGSAHIEVGISPLILAYINDLQSFTADEEAPDSLITEEAIKEGMGKSENVKLTSVSLPSEGTIIMDLAFDSFASLEAEAKEGLRKDFEARIERGEKFEKSIDEMLAESSTVFSYSEADGLHKLRLTLNLESWEQMLDLLPADFQNLLIMFGPDPTNPYSREEYMDYVVDATFGGAEGEEGLYPEYDAREIFESSVMTFAIQAPGSIVSQKGGRISGNTAVFEVPLLQLLTLDKPIEIEAVFK